MISDDPNLDILVLNDYNSECTLSEIQKKYNISYKYVKRILKRNNIIYQKTSKSLTRNRKIDWNIDFLSNNSPDLAYIAGFIFADGNLAERKLKTGSTYKLSVALNEKDTNVLEYICDCLGLNYERINYIQPRIGQQQRHICIGHKKLAELLKPWGVIPNKTYNFIPPNISDDLLPHFLRGWIDGDGTIRVRCRKSSYIRLTGNKEALNWFIDNVHRLGYSEKIYKSEWYEGKVWGKIIIQNRKNILWFKKTLLCDDFFCIKRKWDIIPD